MNIYLKLPSEDYSYKNNGIPFSISPEKQINGIPCASINF